MSMMCWATLVLHADTARQVIGYCLAHETTDPNRLSLTWRATCAHRPCLMDATPTAAAAPPLALALPPARRGCVLAGCSSVCQPGVLLFPSSCCVAFAAAALEVDAVDAVA